MTKIQETRELLHAAFYEAALVREKYADMVGEPEYTMFDSLETIGATHIGVLTGEQGEVLALAALDIFPRSGTAELAIFEVAKTYRGQRKQYCRTLVKEMFDFVRETLGPAATLEVARFSTSGEKRLKPLLQHFQFMPENRDIELVLPLSFSNEALEPSY